MNYIPQEHFERLRAGKIKRGDLLFCLRGSLGKYALVDNIEEGAIASSLVIVRPKSSLSPRFLSYYFASPLCASEIGQYANGAAQPNLSAKNLAAFRIPLPPLEEQRQIVAVLDEAFEGLSRARANAEANLHSARELFECALREALKVVSGDWRTLAVADTISRTKVPAKIQRKAYLEEGAFPIISQEAEMISGYWNDAEDLVRVERPLVLFGDHTRVLKYIDFDFVVGADGTQLLAPIECLHPRFYFFLLKAIDLKGKGYARHFSHLKKCTISFPDSIETQKDIADRLDELQAMTEELELQYLRTLRELEALRQSFLKKAFAGELTVREFA